jgi:hypothetical protein
MKFIDGVISWVRSVEDGVKVYYLMFIVSFFVEGGAVKLLVHYGGIPLSIAGFILVGGALGFIELWHIDPNKPLKDPIMKAALYWTKRKPLVGYLINALVIGGAPGVAIVAVKLNQPRRVALVSATAIAFAVVWTLIWK